MQRLAVLEWQNSLNSMEKLSTSMTCHIYMQCSTFLVQQNDNKLCYTLVNCSVLVETAMLLEHFYRVSTPSIS